ncbi:hypothetical protein MIR68_003495 [Amoeboaphelidium protococcarum]|nr:hypothetical protein MIR68_003495 [Amoeboaphelidium protococcarum]
MGVKVTLRLYSLYLFWRGVLFTLLSYVLPGLVIRFNRNSPALAHAQGQVPTQAAVLITGCSSGIGADAALYLASSGYLVFACVRRPEDGERLVQLFRSIAEKSQVSVRNGIFQGKIVPLMCDVVKQDTIDKAVKRVEEVCAQQNASLISIVNNAGVSFACPLEMEDLKHVQNVFDINLFGVMRITQAFLPLIRKYTVQSDQNAGDRSKGGSGRVVFISSQSGTASIVAMGIYSATKFSMEAIADSLRQEVLNQGIAVSIIKPGAVFTPIFDKANVQNNNAYQKIPKEKKLIADTWYHDIYEAIKVKVTMMRDFGIPTRFVSLSIKDAIEASVPATRYLVGPECVLGVNLRTVLLMVGTLGDGIFDAVIRKTFYIGKQVGEEVLEEKKVN